MKTKAIDNLNNFLEDLFVKRASSAKADDSFIASLARRLKAEFQQRYPQPEKKSFFSYFPSFPRFPFRPAFAPALILSLILIIGIGLKFYLRSASSEIVSLNKSIIHLESSLTELNREIETMISNTDEALNQEFESLETTL